MYVCIVQLDSWDISEVVVYHCRENQSATATPLTGLSLALSLSFSLSLTRSLTRSLALSLFRSLFLYRSLSPRRSLFLSRALSSSRASSLSVYRALVFRALAPTRTSRARARCLTLARSLYACFRDFPGNIESNLTGHLSPRHCQPILGTSEREAWRQCGRGEREGERGKKGEREARRQ